LEALEQTFNAQFDLVCLSLFRREIDHFKILFSAEVIVARPHVIFRLQLLADLLTHGYIIFFCDTVGTGFALLGTIFILSIDLAYFGESACF